MTRDEALARVIKLAERRREKAQAYADAAVEYEARAISADEVLSGIQRDLFIALGLNAQRSAATMAQDAEALDVILFLAGQAPEAKP